MLNTKILQYLQLEQIEQNQFVIVHLKSFLSFYALLKVILK
jgi:hypothetical protein